MMSTGTLRAIGLAFLALCTQASLALAAPTRLELSPSELTLVGAGEDHGVLDFAVEADGRLVDVTAQAKFTSIKPEVVAVHGAKCRCVADGQTEVTIEFSGLQAKIPVTVKQAAGVHTPSFRNDVLPLLTRYGCNQGGCHGKQAGQNGFRLSLRGYAPELDHHWLAKEYFGRRISLTSPADSLLLKKPLGQTPHAGGRLFESGSAAANLLTDWIKAGAPGIVEKEPKVQRIELLPASRVTRPGDLQQLLVRAYYDDGAARDVTWLARFFANEPSHLEVSPGGLVKTLRAGESVIRVHFQDQVAVAGFTAPFEAQVNPQQFAERRNLIDQHVMDKLSALRIPPSPLCDDATFLRRAMLDTIGVLPTPEEVHQFLANASSDKRARLIESLFARPEFIDYWTLQLADQFQNRKERDHDVRGTKGVRQFHAWLRSQVAANRPWNELARDVLLATGEETQSPQIGYYVVTVGENRRAEESEVIASVAQSFLGARVGCAKCHNHPLEKYTQDDYYHLAGFFARLSLDRTESWKGTTRLIVASEDERNRQREMEQNEKQLTDLLASLPGKSATDVEQIRRQIDEQTKQRDQRRKDLDEVAKRPVTAGQPRTGERMIPQPLDRSATAVQPGEDPRVALARWITDPKNDYFSGNMVNRLWKQFFAVGLVEPVDDLRASNPPSNRPLWTALNKEFVDHNFDLRQMIRLILNSRTYQLSSATLPENAVDARFYSHYYARRLPAETLLDALSQATGVPDDFPGYPLGMRAVQLPDTSVNSYFLGLFGRSDRVTACACERRGDVTLPQLLHLQSGDSITQKLTDGDGRLKALLAANLEPAKLVETLFLVTLSRLPNDAERASVVAALAEPDNREEALRDLFWTLLNTKEFAFNH